MTEFVKYLFRRALRAAGGRVHIPRGSDADKRLKQTVDLIYRHGCNIGRKEGRGLMRADVAAMLYKWAAEQPQEIHRATLAAAAARVEKMP